MVDFAGIPPSNIVPSKFTRVYYRDLNCYYYQNPEVPDLLLSNITATDMQLAYLFGTPTFTRDFWPTFGCRIPDLLFEPCHPLTAEEIRREIISVVGRWQPRVRLVTGEVRVIAVPEYQAFLAEVPYDYTVDGGVIANANAAQIRFNSRFGTNATSRASLGDGKSTMPLTRRLCRSN